MNRSIISYLVVAATTVWLAQPVMAAESTTTADISRQTSETWNTIKSYTLDKKTEAVAFGRQLMKDTDEKIAQLEAKAAKASGEAKVAYDKQIADLKVTRANTAAKLEEMEKKSGSAWNEAKQGFANAYRDLQSAYGRAAAKFK